MGFEPTASRSKFEVSVTCAPGIKFLGGLPCAHSLGLPRICSHSRFRSSNTCCLRGTRAGVSSYLLPRVWNGTVQRSAKALPSKEVNKSLWSSQTTTRTCCRLTSIPRRKGSRLALSQGAWRLPSPVGTACQTRGTLAPPLQGMQVICQRILLPRIWPYVLYHGHHGDVDG